MVIAITRYAVRGMLQPPWKPKPINPLLGSHWGSQWVGLRRIAEPDTKATQSDCVFVTTEHENKLNLIVWCLLPRITKKLLILMVVCLLLRIKRQLYLIVRLLLLVIKKTTTSNCAICTAAHKNILNLIVCCLLLRITKTQLSLIVCFLLLRINNNQIELCDCCCCAYII